MANSHGGQRTPANPAPASGPGALSKRTDGGPAAAQYVAGLPYGEGQDFMDLQTSAPLGGQAAAQPRMRSGAANPQGGGLVPLGAPTERPDEPLTEGNPFGPGAGPEVLPLKPSRSAQDVQILAKYLPQLRMLSNQQDAPAGFKAFVQFLNGQ